MPRGHLAGDRNTGLHRVPGCGKMPQPRSGDEHAVQIPAPEQFLVGGFAALVFLRFFLPGLGDQVLRDRKPFGIDVADRGMATSPRWSSSRDGPSRGDRCDDADADFLLFFRGGGQYPRPQGAATPAAMPVLMKSLRRSVLSLDVLHDDFRITAPFLPGPGLKSFRF